MAVACSGSMSSAPELVDGELDQPVRCWRVLAFESGGDGEEGVREHRQGGPAVPGRPAPRDSSPGGSRSQILMEATSMVPRETCSRSS